MTVAFGMSFATKRIPARNKRQGIERRIVKASSFFEVRILLKSLLGFFAEGNDFIGVWGKVIMVQELLLYHTHAFAEISISFSSGSVSYILCLLQGNLQTSKTLFQKIEHSY